MLGHSRNDVNMPEINSDLPWPHRQLLSKDITTCQLQADYMVYTKIFCADSLTYIVECILSRIANELQVERHF